MSLQALLGVVRHLVVERIGVDVNYEVVRHLFGLLGSGWVELAGLRHPIRPWQERVHNLIGELAGVGHLGQQPLDVKPGIEPVGLGRGGDAVYRRRRPRAAWRIAEEPVLAPYDEDSLGLLGDVVRELQVPVFEHVHDVGPELHGVLQRTVQRQLRLYFVKSVFRV